MEVKETVIRLMTRLAIEHQAVNFSQGFTDEAPVYDMVWGGVAAMLGGTEEGVRRLDSMTLREVLEAQGQAGSNSLDLTLKELLAGVRNPRDQLNQYSFPFGIPELRHAIAGLHGSLLRPSPRSGGADYGGARRERRARGVVPLAARSGRRGGGDAALPRALSVTGGDLRVRAAVRDPARRSRRGHLAARP